MTPSQAEPYPAEIATDAILDAEPAPVAAPPEPLSLPGAILAFLESHPGRHAVDVIAAKVDLGADKACLVTTLRDLARQKQIASHGNGRYGAHHKVERNGRGVRRALVHFLAAHRGPQSGSDVTRGIGASARHAVAIHWALTSLVATGEVTCVGTGIYAWPTRPPRAEPESRPADGPQGRVEVKAPRMTGSQGSASARSPKARKKDDAPPRSVDVRPSPPRAVEAAPLERVCRLLASHPEGSARPRSRRPSD